MLTVHAVKEILVREFPACEFTVTRDEVWVMLVAWRCYSIHFQHKAFRFPVEVEDWTPYLPILRVGVREYLPPNAVPPEGLKPGMVILTGKLARVREFGEET